jgi:hypothetical protein
MAGQRRDLNVAAILNDWDENYFALERILNTESAFCDIWRVQLRGRRIDPNLDHMLVEGPIREVHNVIPRSDHPRRSAKRVRDIVPRLQRTAA